MDLSELPFKLFAFLVLVCSLSLHEWGHAFVADKLGDPLPRAQGRVTINPLAHIDLIGTVLLPLGMILFSPGFAIIGWAKPVQVSLQNPKTRMRDDLVSTAAGPAVNLLLAVILSVVAGFVAYYAPQYFEALTLAITLNLLLFVFNLIPLPPLDGSHFLPYVGMSYETYARIASFSIIILIVLINTPLWGGLMKVMLWIYAPLQKLTEAIYLALA